MAIKMKTYTQTKDSNSAEEISEDFKQNIYNILQNQPLTFIENRGQIDPSVKYYVKGSGYTFYFTPNEIKFSFIQKKPMTSHSKCFKLNSFTEEAGEDRKEEFMGVTVGLNFIDINSELIIEPQNKLKSTVNYFKGSDPTKWQTQIPTFEKIIYKEIWSGIDLVFYGENGKLKYDFIVQPKASIEDIKFAYEGYEEKFIDDNGNLIIRTPLGEFIDERPICYQEIEGKKIMLESNFISTEEKSITIYGYEIKDEYNKNHPIIIDPGIIYSSYLGGSGVDAGLGIAIDQNGNAYVTGFTNSFNFPTVNAFQPIIGGNLDAFVTKIDSIPAIIYSSYLGGSSIDQGFGIAVDQSGNVYVTGETRSTDFPIMNAFQPSIGGGFNDAFVTKIDSTPAIVYSSYLGGSGSDIGNGITVDQSGNAYVTGSTSSFDFPTVNAFQPSFGGGSDAFVTKIDSSPAIVYSSFLGGNSPDGGMGIAVDQIGNVYITGITFSTNFPTSNAFQPSFGGGSDAFVTKIDSSPAIIYSSFLGGSSIDQGFGIVVDQNGNVYVTGETRSTDFPVMNAFQPSIGGGFNDAFVTKIDSTPNIVYSSYMGGSGFDQGFGIAVDINGNAYVTGSTNSFDFPTVNAFQSTIGGSTDAFVTKIDSTPTIIYSSYLGGSGNDGGRGIAVDQIGNVYLAGFTSSNDFPTRNAFQPFFNVNQDAFVTKIGGSLFLTVNAANLSAVVFN